MFRVVFLLTAVTVVRASSKYDVDCSEMNARIVGGSTTNITKVPYQISLQSNGEHICGGSIYSETTIITAAHCLENVSTSSLKVLAGSSSRVDGSFFPVKDFKVHEHYNEWTDENDIALVYLKKKLEFSDSIKKIELATTEPEHNAKAHVCGWGKISSTEEYLPQHLRCVCVMIINNANCGSYAYNDSPHKIKPSMICAALPGKDACESDSGGPLVSDGVLVGIVSFRAGCAEKCHPGVYANVAYLRRWIKKNAKM